jgi:hypothetical protein
MRERTGGHTSYQGDAAPERGRSDSYAVRRSSQGNQAAADRGHRRKERGYQPANESLHDETLAEDELADGQPDVVLDVPVLKVDEINLEVDELQARISLQAQVLDLLRLHVGADVSIGRVSLDIKGVEAAALLKVRLDNVAGILDRVMTTIDENPQLLEDLTRAVGAAAGELSRGAGAAVEEVGQGTGGAVEQVGGGARHAAAGIGRGTSRAVEEVGRGASGAARGLGRGAGAGIERAGEGAGPAARSVGENAGQAAGGRPGRGGEDRGAGEDFEDLADELEGVTGRGEEVADEADDAHADWRERERPRRSPRDRAQARPLRSHREKDPPPGRRARMAQRDR